MGKPNFRLNGRTGTFLHGAISESHGRLLRFTNESDGSQADVLQYDLDSVMEAAGIDRADVLLVDTQGAATPAGLAIKARDFQR